MGKVIKFGVIGVVVLGVALLFAKGILTTDDAKQIGRKTYYQGKGVVGNLMEVPTGSNSPEDAAKCRENLRAIESAKRKAAQQKGQVDGALTVQEVERAMGRPMPRCPSGGRYNIGALVQLPSCSILNSGNVDPRDDHVLKGF